jgi:predicted Zn-dependent protease
VTRARELLEGVRADGGEDPEVLFGLALAEWNARRRHALAEGVLAAGDRAAYPTRIGALEMAVHWHATSGSLRAAEPLLRELLAARRAAVDASVWADLARERGDRAEALQSTRRALGIEPTSLYVQEKAAETFAWLGDAEAAALHRRIAARLRERQGR